MGKTSLFRTFEAEGALEPWRIVSFAGPCTVAQATGPDRALIGTSDELGVQPNGRADIAMAGQPEVVAGGPLAPGDAITSDAEGRAVKATATGQHILGFACAYAVNAGEIIDYIYAPGLFAAAPDTEGGE